jgi:hypothetical protein
MYTRKEWSVVKQKQTYQRTITERLFTARLVSSSAPDLLEINADLLWFRIEQRIRRAGALEMWNSLSVYCEQEASGALLVRVVIFNPDWDGPLQIAAIRSWPNDSKNLTPVACNLDHVAS